MKLILKNSTLVFEKGLTKVNIDSYDAFGGTLSGAGNVSYNSSKTDYNVKLYNVSQFAGSKLHITVYYNLSPSNPADPAIGILATSALTHEDAVDNIIRFGGTMFQSTATGLTREWLPEKHPACCKISGEIDIPVGTAALALCAGDATITQMSYPDNSEVYYYE